MKQKDYCDTIILGVWKEKKCQIHPKSDAIGYCQKCGLIGCEGCLTEESGNLLCLRCSRKEIVNNPPPPEETERKETRQRLVVRYKDGRIKEGTSYAMDIDSRGFHIFQRSDEDSVAKREFVNFDEVKAVFFVRNYNG